jgi:putative Holliday junction resolvase
MMLLGVDFGFKRIGLAQTDSNVGLPKALQPMAASGSLKKDAQAIFQAARNLAIDEIVVGLPVEPSGEEGRMARICRELANEISGHGIRVHLVDESMTSYAGEGRMIEAGLKPSQRRRRLDGEAAAEILQRFLNGS